MSLLTAVLALPALVTAQSKASIDWKNYSDDVLKAARDSGKPLLIEVWGEWCPPCRKMDREVWSDQRVAALSKKFVCVSVEIGPHGPLPNTQLMFGSHGLYNINGLPAIVVMDPWREVLVLTEGYRHVSDVLAMLGEIPAEYNEVRTWLDALEKDRNNSRALQRVGALYQGSTAFGIANRYYREAVKCTGAKEDNILREDLMFDIAANEVRRADWRAARKALDRFKVDFPASPRQDQILLGLVLTDVKQGKMSEAVGHLEELKERFPESAAIRVAERITDRAKEPGRPSKARRP